jgi:hypothetical protein
MTPDLAVLSAAQAALACFKENGRLSKFCLHDILMWASSRFESKAIPDKPIRAMVFSFGCERYLNLRSPWKSVQSTSLRQSTI